MAEDTSAWKPVDESAWKPVESPRNKHSLKGGPSEAAPVDERGFWEHFKDSAMAMPRMLKGLVTGDVKLSDVPRGMLEGMGNTLISLGQRQYGEAAGDVAGAAVAGKTLGMAGAAAAPVLSKAGGAIADTAGKVADVAGAATDPAVIRAGMQVIPKGPAVLNLVDQFKAARARKIAARQPQPTVIGEDWRAKVSQATGETFPPAQQPIPQAPAPGEPALPPRGIPDIQPPGAVPGSGIPEPVSSDTASVSRQTSQNEATTKPLSPGERAFRKARGETTSSNSASNEGTKAEVVDISSAKTPAQQAAEALRDAIQPKPVKGGIARAMADELAKRNLTPDEAKGMPLDDWASLAKDVGVKAPNSAGRREVLFNLKRKLAGPERTPEQLFEAARKGTK